MPAWLRRVAPHRACEPRIHTHNFAGSVIRTLGQVRTLSPGYTGKLSTAVAGRSWDGAVDGAGVVKPALGPV